MAMPGRRRPGRWREQTLVHDRQMATPGSHRAGTPPTLLAVTPDIRASDADRHATVEALRSHYAVGRLDTEELERRVSRAASAQSLSELAEVTADLPDTSGVRAGARDAH